MAQDGLTPQERFAREMGALSQTDPEFMQIFSRFAFTDVPEGCTLDAPTRYLACLLYTSSSPEYELSCSAVSS